MRILSLVRCFYVLVDSERFKTARVLSIEIPTCQKAMGLHPGRFYPIAVPPCGSFYFLAFDNARRRMNAWNQGF